MLKIFLSSTYRDLAEYRSKVLDNLNAAFNGVGMEQFIPDGSNSQEVCIGSLKRANIIIFLISPYYGSLMDNCALKEDCKAECPMKMGTGKISYTHCEYKTTKAEGILHQTYLVGKGWDASDVKREALQFRDEIGEEYLGFVDIEDPELVQSICNNLAIKIVEWHTQNKLDFPQFCDRETVLNELIENMGNKVEVWGVGGIGKTALIEVALLIQKLKGKRILAIGTSKAYASGSGFEDFRTKCKEDQYIAESRNEITIYDLINAFADNGFLHEAEEVSKMPKEKIIDILSKVVRNEENLVLFIDDFHLATEDVVEVAKSTDHLILSSRKNTYIANKEISLSGISQEDRKNLIKLFSTEIPEKAMEVINTIAEGHPVSTELLVRNYQNIDFDKLKAFDLSDADDNQVKDFYKRVIEEIFSTNQYALTLLKDLATLNTDLPTNIHRESVINSYNIEEIREMIKGFITMDSSLTTSLHRESTLKSYDVKSIRKMFNTLIDTGMLKKRQGTEDTYEFYFKHVQDYLEDEANKDNHIIPLLYYMKKGEILHDKYTIDDDVEILYHMTKIVPEASKTVEAFLNQSTKVQPVNYSFKRIIDIGEKLKFSVEDRHRAAIQNNLGLQYLQLKRFREAETAFTEALNIRKELANNNPDAYLPLVARAYSNLGVIYRNLRCYEEAETAYTKASEIFRDLVATNPDTYLSMLAQTQNNLGLLYWELRRFSEAELVYAEALNIRKDLAKKDPDSYLPDLAATQLNLGILYKSLSRFEEAESFSKDALSNFKELAIKKPAVYIPNVALAQNNLGLLFIDLGRFEEAEKVYNEALIIRRELVERNPEAYLLDYTETQAALGALYHGIKMYDKAEKYYKAVLEVYKQLAKDYPKVYTTEVIRTLENLRYLYIDLENHEEAEKLNKKVNELKTIKF